MLSQNLRKNLLYLCSAILLTSTAFSFSAHDPSWEKVLTGKEKIKAAKTEKKARKKTAKAARAAKGTAKPSPEILPIKLAELEKESYGILSANDSLDRYLPMVTLVYTEPKATDVIPNPWALITDYSKVAPPPSFGSAEFMRLIDLEKAGNSFKAKIATVKTLLHTVKSIERQRLEALEQSAESLITRVRYISGPKSSYQIKYNNLAEFKATIRNPILYCTDSKSVRHVELGHLESIARR